MLHTSSLLVKANIYIHIFLSSRHNHASTNRRIRELSNLDRRTHKSHHTQVPIPSPKVSSTCRLPPHTNTPFITPQPVYPYSHQSFPSPIPNLFLGQKRTKKAKINNKAKITRIRITKEKRTIPPSASHR